MFGVQTYFSFPYNDIFYNGPGPSIAIVVAVIGFVVMLIGLLVTAKVLGRTPEVVRYDSEPSSP